MSRVRAVRKESAPASASKDMRSRIAAFDWASTPLGPPAQWSPTLQTAVDLCLGSRMCSCLYWGPDHLIIYNDAYSTILGAKHPRALGQRAAAVWPEIFDVLGPLMAQTYTTGATTGGDDVAIFLNRSGYVEEFYCSFSYAALRDHTGRIEAVFATLPETSIRVIGERRLTTLQQLGADAREAREPAHTLRIAAEVMSANPYDLPFVVFYTWRQDSGTAELCARSNIAAGEPLSAATIDLDGPDELAKAIRSSLADGYAVVPLTQAYAPIPQGAWQQSARELMVLPLVPYGENALRAVMFAGVSPHKRLDEPYLAFFRMLADQLKRSLSEAFSHEQEDLRLRDLQRRARADQAAERMRIARDLHDTLLQSVQGMRFLLEAGLTKARSGDPAANSLFEDALLASEQAIEEGREVLSLLRTTTQSVRGQRASIEGLGSELVLPATTSFVFAAVGTEREMPADVWSEAYSICREAVANAARHAHASTIKVEVHYSVPFEITITDDGRGFDPRVAEAGRPGHFGLAGMRERAANLGGTLSVGPNRPGGTRVVLRVPAE